MQKLVCHIRHCMVDHALLFLFYSFGAQTKARHLCSRITMLRMRQCDHNSLQLVSLVSQSVAVIKIMGKKLVALFIYPFLCRREVKPQHLSLIYSIDLCPHIFPLRCSFLQPFFSPFYSVSPYIFVKRTMLEISGWNYGNCPVHCTMTNSMLAETNAPHAVTPRITVRQLYVHAEGIYA